jgi:hypothetical protein
MAVKILNSDCDCTIGILSRTVSFTVKLLSNFVFSLENTVPHGYGLNITFEINFFEGVTNSLCPLITPRLLRTCLRISYPRSYHLIIVK